MGTSDIGSFKIGDVKDSNLMVGLGNGAVTAARRLADPVSGRPGILDLALRETRWDYEYKIESSLFMGLFVSSLRKEWVSLQKDLEYVNDRLLAERFLKEAIASTGRRLAEVEAFDWSKLKSKDVDVQFGNRTVVDLYQIVDLKIFVDIGGEAGSVNFQDRVRLPKDAILDGRKWRVSDGVLTISLPKESAFNDGSGEGDGKRRRRALEAVNEDCFREDSCGGRRR